MRVINSFLKGVSMFKVSTMFLMVSLTIISCGTTKTAKLSSNDPIEAIREIESLKESGLRNQYDLLGYNSFRDGEKSLNNAIFKLSNKSDREDILEKLSESKAYFLEAEKVARRRTAVPDRILSARSAAVSNEIRQDDDLREELEETDKSLRYQTESFTEDLSVESLSQFEKDYLELEIEAVQSTKLNNLRSIVEDSKRRRAERIAPKTLRNASSDLMAAENMIQQTPRNPSNYNKSVTKAEHSAKLLEDVMKKLNGLASGASEDVALKLVFQERILGALSDKTSHLQSSLVKSNNDLNQAQDQLQVKTTEANTATTKVKLQEALDQMRNNFTKDEADVYQQGGDLIIRLKTIDFKSGSAMVPSKSMNLLAKVNQVIGQLSSTKVLVEGHTDSSGQSENNKALSLKRSKAVARYLGSLGSSYEISSLGFGESRPIANNQTREGRAINRRVDIVVTSDNNR